MTLLSDLEIQQRLQQHPNWTRQQNEISRVWKFQDFVEAIAFVNALVAPAETAGHHPDIAISYNCVTLSLSTHDAGGLTQKDFDLAAQFDQLAV